MQVYDFGKVKLHAYDTCDAMTDSVFLLQKDGNLLIIEQPAFYEGEKELAAYMDTLDAKPQARLLSYHMSGVLSCLMCPLYHAAGAGIRPARGRKSFDRRLYSNLRCAV